jgi:hypothetical protein
MTPEVTPHMSLLIDQSVYPDLDEPPSELLDDAAKADYLHRVCTAWDFGIMPDNATFEFFASWKDIFDRFLVSASPAYHAFRARMGWNSVPWPHGIKPPTPQWGHQDRIGGRDADPCDGFI